MNSRRRKALILERATKQKEARVWLKEWNKKYTPVRKAVKRRAKKSK